jgi:flagellar basal-body rod protein FlgB
MAISVDDALGVHPYAMKLAHQRSQVIGANLANADTPNYKARDIDFQGAMRAELGRREGLTMTTTSEGHLAGPGGNPGELQYRVPFQPSIDGNTVDAAKEQTRFSENSMRYMASLQFVEGTFSTLNKAAGGQG